MAALLEGPTLLVIIVLVGIIIGLIAWTASRVGQLRHDRRVELATIKASARMGLRAEIQQLSRLVVQLNRIIEDQTRHQATPQPPAGYPATSQMSQVFAEDIRVRG